MTYISIGNLLDWIFNVLDNNQTNAIQSQSVDIIDGERQKKIMSVGRSFLFVSVLSSISVTAHYDIDDSLLYKIDFPGLPQESINPSKLKSVIKGYQFIHL